MESKNASDNETGKSVSDNEKKSESSKKKPTPEKKPPKKVHSFFSKYLST